MTPLHEPGGQSRLASFLRSVVRAVKECRLLDGVGYKVERTQNGSILKIAPSSFGAGGATVHTYYLREVAGDYLKCNTELLGVGGTVYVAKMPHMRHSIDRETIIGKELLYNYTQNSQYPLIWYRNCLDDSLRSWVETQVPAYLEDQVIIAIDHDTGVLDYNGDPIDKIELNVRAWAG